MEIDLSSVLRTFGLSGDDTLCARALVLSFLACLVAAGYIFVSWARQLPSLLYTSRITSNPYTTRCTASAAPSARARTKFARHSTISTAYTPYRTAPYRHRRLPSYQSRRPIVCIATPLGASGDGREQLGAGDIRVGPPAPQLPMLDPGERVGEQLDASHNITSIVSRQQFNEMLINNDDSKLVVVKFHMPKCRACSAVAPKFKKLAKDYGDRATFVEVDFTMNKMLCRQLGINAVPKIQFYRTDLGRLETLTGAPSKWCTVKEHFCDWLHRAGMDIDCSDIECSWEQYLQINPNPVL